MLNIQIDRDSGKGVIRMGGEPLEVANDFMNLFTEIYEASPDVFLIITTVIGDFAAKLEEELMNDKNNSSNKS